MSEPRIGRVLVASLHQAIADVLPTRLEFYENWLNSAGLREGTIGLAPLSAVLSFLRTEGDAYSLITARAGQYAADWTVNNLSTFERRVIGALPRALRTRAALRTARSLVRSTYPGSRAIVRLRRGTASIDLRGSLFCEVREASALPLCGFYAAAIEHALALLDVPAAAQVSECRASIGRSASGAGETPSKRNVQRCLLSVIIQGARADEPAAAA
jgi:hypothetical protein